MLNPHARFTKLCWLAALGLSLLYNLASSTPTAPIQKNQSASTQSGAASWYVPNQGYQLTTVKIHKDPANFYGITMEFCPKTGACTTPVSHCYGDSCSSGTTTSLAIPKIATSVYFCCAKMPVLGYNALDHLIFTLLDGSTVETIGFTTGCDLSCSSSVSLLGNFVGVALVPKSVFLVKYFSLNNNQASCWDDYECSYLTSGAQGTPIDTFGKCSFTAAKSIKYATNISTLCFTAVATVISFKKDGFASSQPSWISHDLSTLTFTFNKPIDADFGSTFDVFINSNLDTSSFTIATVDDCGTPDPCLGITFSIDSSIIAASTTYNLADPSFSFPALDRAKIIPNIVASCPALQLDVMTSGNSDIDSTLFTFASDVLNVYTTDSTKIMTYNMLLRVKYSGVQYSYKGSLPFAVIVTDPCLAVNFLIDPSIIAATTTYYLSDLKLIFQALDRTKIIPSITIASCPALQLVIETSVNAAIDSTVFKFASDVLDVHTTDSTKIGTYGMVLKVKYLGYSNQGSLPFTVIVAGQVCASATLIPLPNPELPPYKYTGDKLNYNFVLFRVDPAQCPVSYSCVSITHQSSTKLDCNSTQINWKNSNTLFEFATSDLTITPGNYTVTYRGQIGKANCVNTFVLSLVDPCPSIEFFLLPIQFEVQTYVIGASEKGFKWINSVVAKWQSPLDCGPLTITKFWTKDGNGQQPLSTALFQVDYSALTFKIKSDDIRMAGTYEVFYDVSLNNYETNKKSSTQPITITALKPNTAPKLSGLSFKQQTFDVLLQNENHAYVFVGKPSDEEGDQVTLTFENNGEKSISFNKDSEQIEIASKIAPDSYIVSFKLKDDNNDSLTSDYLVTLNVTLAIPEALNETNSTSINASDTSQKQNNASIAQINQGPSILDPEMKLKSFSQTGVLQFVFNQPFIVPRNLTYIDLSVLNISIDILPENDIKFFNFTWNVTKFTDKYMDVQLVFKEAYYVQVDHFINVQVFQKEFFASRETIRAMRDLRPILDSNLKMRIRCIPQIQLGGSAKAIMSSADKAIKSTKAIIASKFMFNLSFNTALGMLWGMINGLQILSIMPLVDCEMPGNAQFFFMQIYTIASFNVINVSSITSMVSDKLHLQQNLNRISARMQGFGFNTTSQIDNLGIVFIFFMLVGAYLIMLAFLSCLTRVRFKRVFRPRHKCKCRGQIQNYLRQATAGLFWNFLIRLFIETYLDNAIVNALKLKALMWHPWAECLSSLFAIIIVAALVIYPIASWILMFKFKARLNDEEVQNRFGAAYKEIRTSSNTALGYPSIFMIKRLVFTLFIFLVQDSRILQHFLIINMLAGSTAYTWESEPFTDNLSNFQEVYNDYMVSIVSYSLLVFSDFVPDKKAQYRIGWVVCVLIGVQVATNMGIIIFGLVKTLINRYKLKNIKKQREQERITKAKERLEIREALELLESLNAEPESQLVNAKRRSQFRNHFVQPLSRLRQKLRRDKIGNLSILPLERVSEEESQKGSVNADLESLPDLNDELRVSPRAVRNQDRESEQSQSNQLQVINVEAKFKTFEPTEEMKQPAKVQNKVVFRKVQNKVIVQIAESLSNPKALKHQEAHSNYDDDEEKKIQTIAFNIYAKKTRDLLQPSEAAKVKSETVSVVTTMRTNPNPVTSILIQSRQVQLIELENKFSFMNLELKPANNQTIRKFTRQNQNF